MKNIVNGNSKETQQEKMIEKALRTGGFIFPETIDEVKEFERIYGTTDVILPAELQEPNFLYTQARKIGKAKVATLHPENLAMAAREGSNHQLPDDIKKRMAEDRKKADLKRKRKK